MALHPIDARDWVSTSEAASLCGVSHMTIIRRFDAGDIKGFKVPGSRFRRIPKHSLADFAQKHGLPGPAFVKHSAHGELDQTGRSGLPRVMVVEDDHEISGIMRKVLEAKGWEVAVAANGFDAGFTAARFQPDLVVLDIMLPGLDGREVCRRLRRDARFSHTKIIAVTALTDEASKREIFAAGVDAYLPKPFTMQEFMEKVSEVALYQTAGGEKAALSPAAAS